MFGIRQQPVEEPRPAQVQQREQAGAGDGEQRHRLGEAVDRRAPLLVQQQQDRRDQRAGVADADPPDEVDDGEAPGDRDVDAPDADAREQQVGDRRTAAASTSSERDRRSRATSRAACGAVSTIELILSVTERVGVPGRDDRRAAVAGVVGVGGSVRSAIAQRSSRSSGFGLRKAARYVVRGRVFSSASSA